MEQMSNLSFIVLGSLLISASAALLGERPVRARLHYGAYTFLCSVAGILAGGWVMYWIHR